MVKLNKCKHCIYFNKQKSTCMWKKNKKVDGESKPCNDFR